MTVSMTALLRLFLYSFLFGISIGLFYLLFRFASSFLSTRDLPLSDGRIAALPERVRVLVRQERRSRVVKGASFFVSFFGEVAFCLFAAASLAVFYYCFNDGIPRLFSLLAVLAGFVLLQKTLGRPFERLFDRLYRGLYLLFLYALAYLIRPPLFFAFSILRRMGGWLFAVKKRLFSLALSVCSPIRMKRYMKKELSLLGRLSSLEELSD